jgi:hypothetical protein
MKFMLITMMLANPVIYTDETTCELAVSKLTRAGEVTAVCIPVGEEQADPSDQMFDSFIKMVNKIKELEAKNVQ